MAPQLSHKEQGPHQPQPTNIPPVPAGDHAANPSTPVRSIPETPRRHTRKSEPNLDFQTLPGTRWDELDIERQRERQRGREAAADSTGTPSLDRLSLREKRTQVSSRRTAATKDSDLIPEIRRTRHPARQSGPQNSLESPANDFSQPLAEPSSSAKKSRRKKRQGPTGRQSKAAPQTGLDSQPQLLTANELIGVGRDLAPGMARRPGRNQVDYVAELKETIHESLSKLSDIQEKQAPLGQQILALEEELKAKEGDSSKPRAYPGGSSGKVLRW